MTDEKKGPKVYATGQTKYNKKDVFVDILVQSMHWSPKVEDGAQAEPDEHPADDIAANEDMLQSLIAGKNMYIRLRYAPAAAPLAKVPVADPNDPPKE